LEASASEPEPVLSPRTVIGLLGWLTVLTGIFLLIIGCSWAHRTSCTSNLSIDSALVTVVGALLLATAWLTGEKGDKTPLKTSVKMLAKYLLILPGVAILIVVVLLLTFLGLPPG
jgi:hypothetical protein